MFFKLRSHSGNTALNRRIILILQIMLVVYAVNIISIEDVWINTVYRYPDLSICNNERKNYILTRILSEYFQIISASVLKYPAK